MGKERELPEQAKKLYELGPLGISKRVWVSDAEGWTIEMFGLDEAMTMNEDLELWRKMPGWFAIGQDASDALLCVDSKTGACSMVEVDDLCRKSAQEISKTLGELLAQGEWR
jgi:hypothetical protein